MKSIIRNFTEEYKIHLKNRQETNININYIKELDIQMKQAIHEEQQLRNKINSLSINAESRKNTIEYKLALKKLLNDTNALKTTLNEQISFLPNALNYSTPLGKNEEENQILYIHKSFINLQEYKSEIQDITNTSEYKTLLKEINSYTPKEHIQISLSSNWVNKNDLQITKEFEDIFNISTKIQYIGEYISIQKKMEKYTHLHNYFIYQNEEILANKLKHLFALSYPNINNYITLPSEQNSLPHHEIGKNMNILHMQKAAEISGSRFPIMSDSLSELSRALSSFLLDIQKKHLFREVDIPSIASSTCFYNAGQLPKFDDQTFIIENTDKRLIPTAEVILANIIQNTHIDDKKLPIRYCSLSPCFRSEVGNLGRDVSGLIRLHEFKKVELFTYCNKNDEEDELQYMLKCAYTPLQLLGIKFRIIALCSGDIGFGATKTYDIEAWLPSQNRFLEISSCSSCGNFQTSRTQAKYKSNTHKDFLITLNGSGLPITRLLAIFIENFYNKQDNSITIPSILQKYMNNQEKIIAQPPLF